MNLDDLTIDQAKELSNLFANQSANQSSSEGLNKMVGKKCMIRTYSAGVWFGVIEQKSGNEVIVNNARRLWRWKAAKSISVSALAIYGIDTTKSRVVKAVDSVWLEAIELIPCSDAAIKLIESADNVEAE